MISRTGIHAIKSLAILAELPDGEFLGASAIARKINAPENYLGKILRSIARTGLLDSQKGKGGGMKLALDPGDISLYMVLQPIDRMEDWEGCFLGSGECQSNNACEVHKRWRPVRDSLIEFLQTTSIRDIAEKTIF